MYLVFPRIAVRLHVLTVPAVCMLFWLEGTYAAALLLLAAFVHECGHLAALRAFGIVVKRIDVLPMGAVIAYDDSLCPHSQTAWIAFAGAGANLLAGAVCLPFLHSLYAMYFFAVNLALAITNLTPIETLDGGTMLRSLLMLGDHADRAEQLCRTVSRVSLLLLAAALIWLGMYSSFPIWHLLLSAVMLMQIFR